MESPTQPDAIDREIRALALARYFLRGEVRTDTITRFTGIPRGRPAALRRRLGVPAEARHRGPARWRIEHFIVSAERRHETAAFAALFVLHNLIGPQAIPAVTLADRLEVGERLVRIYEYLRTFFPDVEIDIEGLVLLRTMLLRRELLVTAKCQTCGCLIVIERNDLRHRTCALCAPCGTAPAARNGSLSAALPSPGA